MAIEQWSTNQLVGQNLMADFAARVITQYLISITLSGPDKESENPLLLTCNLTYPLMKANIQLFLAMMKVVPAFPYFFSLSFSSFSALLWLLLLCLTGCVIYSLFFKLFLGTILF